MIPAGREGIPGERGYTALVSILISDAASYISGQVIGVNGAMVWNY